MARPTNEPVSQSPAADKPGRDFKVVKGLVGPWPHGHVFPESEFRRINAPPDKGPTGQPATDADRDAYYESAFARLLGLGVIVQVNHSNAPAHEAPMPTPVGPESNPPLKPESAATATPAATAAK